MSANMVTPEQKIRQRYAWFQDAERLGSVTFVCHRLGISRKTYFKWQDRSPRPAAIARPSWTGPADPAGPTIRTTG